MSTKKRVFDKELGVELVLDDLDDKTENSGRKRAKFEPGQQTTSATKSNILSRLGNYATNTDGELLKSTDQLAESHHSGDDDEVSENYEDIDYGDDDDDDDEDDFDAKSNQQTVRRGQEDLRSIIERNNRGAANHSDDEHENIRQNLAENDDDNDGQGGHSGDMDTDSKEGRACSEGKDADEKTSSERCKYWPSCKAGDDCTYYHPSKPCRTFPNCRYGQKCLYIHPPCKFNPNCTRPGCQFAHPLKSSRLPGPSSYTPAPQPLAPKCRYGFNCSNLMCKFSHQRSEPCRFGANCLLESCAYTHPSDVTRKKPASVFKWSAQQ